MTDIYLHIDARIYISMLPCSSAATASIGCVTLHRWCVASAGPQLFTEPPANVTIPGQEGNMSVYAPQLAAITAKLKIYAARTGAKLLFAITSPMMANARADQVGVHLSRI